jgi:hypothetical protein
MRILTIALCIGLTTGAAAQETKIVGVGAATCARFNGHVAESPSSERDYLAWAQGFMSGALMRAPPGVDEGLDLLPPTLPLTAQAEFLRTFCRDHPDRDYMDAVRALYHRLRGPSL